MRVKSAEYWLKFGQPAEALMELERLSEGAKAEVLGAGPANLV